MIFAAPEDLQPREVEKPLPADDDDDDEEEEEDEDYLPTSR
jgi:hypothetical protein